MGLFDSIFNKKKVDKALTGSSYLTELKAYQPIYKNFNGKIFESSLVRSAIDARARFISNLEFKFVGSANPQLQNAMKHQPNKYQTYSQFLYQISTILDTDNSVVICPTYDNNMKINGLLPIVPFKCSIVENEKENLFIKYSFGKISGASAFEDSVILTKYQYASNFFGENNEILTNELNVLELHKQGMAELIKQSGIIAYQAKVSNFTIDEDLEDTRSKFEKKQLANGKNKKLILFPNTFSDVQRVSCNQQILDNVQITQIKENVFRYFGVNENILENKATREQIESFYELAIVPFANQFSEAFSRALFTALERSYGSKVILEKKLTRAEKESIAKLLADRGALKVDELRAYFGLEALPDGLGNILTIRGEYKDLSEIVAREYEEE